MTKNKYEISLDETAEMHGYSDSDEMIMAVGMDSVVPACCSEGCEVEPDGTCEHGCESVLLAMGMI